MKIPPSPPMTGTRPSLKRSTFMLVLPPASATVRRDYIGRSSTVEPVPRADQEPVFLVAHGPGIFRPVLLDLT